MTNAEAVALRTFKNYCTCGGFAWTVNGRSHSSPHLRYCQQKKEYREWYDAMYPTQLDAATIDQPQPLEIAHDV